MADKSIRQGRTATYGLENSRNLLEKLAWEINAIAEAPRNDQAALSYYGFNAAITAWHIADWVWRDLSIDRRQELEVQWGVHLSIERDDGNAFKGELRKRNRDLAICREIATASKHVEVTRNPDGTIDAEVSARTDNVVDSKGDPIVVGDDFVVVQTLTLKVQDGDERRELMDVLENVLRDWTEFLDRYGIGQ